ncbi:polysaccharide pyruvyl transferase family protein [Microbacterium paludicola]|uniref:polysaccharide pyruvyl transferase family protein n=1 Tax=Microbacterium paludicola TaxID=300019 RepID=UPI0031E30CA9
MRLRTILRLAVADYERIREAGLARRLSRAAAAGPRAGHVLIAGPGNGSIGDEAMYEAFVRAADDAVTVIAREPADLLWRSESADVRYVYLRDLVYGRPSRHSKDLRTFIDLVGRARSLSVIGADIMDGVYDELASARRFRLAALAASAGADARILGFSWNSHPTNRALNAMRAVGDRVLLLARDEASGRRLQENGGHRVQTVADLAFLTTPDAPLADARLDAWLASERGAGRRIVVVNANPRQEKLFPGLRTQYIALIEQLRADGFSCIILPHDSRGGARSEESYLARIAADVGSEHVYLVEKAPLPDQVVAISREGEIVVSGRMHLVVLASVAGRATVALEYQDKFAGLYRLLGYDGRVVRSESGEWDLVAAVRKGLESARRSELRLADSWPTVLERSRRNLPRISASE